MVGHAPFHKSIRIFGDEREMKNIKNKRKPLQFLNAFVCNWPLLEAHLFTGDEVVCCVFYWLSKSPLNPFGIECWCLINTM